MPSNYQATAAFEVEMPVLVLAVFVFQWKPQVPVFVCLVDPGASWSKTIMPACEIEPGTF